MGLFNLFKKKGDDNNEPKPEDVMLTLNERQKPSLKSDTKPPTAPPAEAKPDNLMLTPDPAVNNGQKTTYDFSEAPAPQPEPQEYLRENLSTKSLEKGMQSMPSIKKLVIPSNDEVMSQKVEATDTITAERVTLKQVDLPGADKSQENISPAATNYIPGEFIDIPISFFTDSIDPKYLSANAKTLFDNTTKVRFTKDEVLSIMGQGAFAVVGSALLARFPQDMVSTQGKSTSEVFNFPLDAVMAMVPPEWFSLKGQDESLMSSLNDMANPFHDFESPAEPQEEIAETPAPKPESSSLFSEDEEEQEVAVQTEGEEEEIDPLATIEQIAPPAIEEEEEIDPLATIEQKAPPVVTAAAKTETDESTLVVPSSVIVSALNPEIFTSFPSDVLLNIPREHVMKSLSEGIFNLKASEVDQFAGTSCTKSNKENEVISIDLSLIMGLIPPEWFALQGQDTSQTDLLSNMQDVFDDSTFEEAAAELQQKEKGLGETVVDADKGSPNEESVDVSVEAPVDEESVEVEEEESDSLITGGIFSKMNNLFEDDEDEEESVEIEEEEQAAEKPLIEEDEAITPIIEEEPEEEQAEVAQDTPANEEPPEEASLDSLQTITVNRDEDKIFDDERLAKEQLKEMEASEETEQVPEEAEKSPTIHSMPTLVQLTPPPKAEKPAEVKPSVEKVVPAATIKDDVEDDVKIVPDAGKITYRPVNEDVPDVTDSAILRPSTAPNGIDINRSNLADLCRLHSAGEKLAQTLIEYREQNGDFKSINEL
ncbi:MAG: helix-hairpin-helix domain-containing protein, partial [Lentisphaeraceae bacterium]|nr:helix-hairpin-helix domain-containing protein [Lentisphaeraceae bacterium]